jgi:predicted SAM-dependent methyltransferase
MQKPNYPKRPSALDMLLDKNAERRYHDKLSQYEEDSRRYDSERYPPVNNGPWGDGE